MHPVTPVPPTDDKWKSIIYAKDQSEYIPLPALRNATQVEVPVITVWEPDEHERAILAQQIADGKVQIHLMVMLFKNKNGAPNPYPPMRMQLTPFTDLTGPLCPMDPAAPVARPDMMWEIGVEGDRFRPHVRLAACAENKCVPIAPDDPFWNTYKGEGE